ncbi:exported hypothetical protein [Candidatus Sulfopaludibacter sp. SbA3]|nr:exported hypothetical protein [Candidatus Sulfopaludibacter sp. SbA3]
MLQSVAISGFAALPAFASPAPQIQNDSSQQSFQSQLQESSDSYSSDTSSDAPPAPPARSPDRSRDRSKPAQSSNDFAAGAPAIAPAGPGGSLPLSLQLQPDARGDLRNAKAGANADQAGAADAEAAHTTQLNGTGLPQAKDFAGDLAFALRLTPQETLPATAGKSETVQSVAPKPQPAAGASDNQAKNDDQQQDADTPAEKHSPRTGALVASEPVTAQSHGIDSLAFPVPHTVVKAAAPEPARTEAVTATARPPLQVEAQPVPRSTQGMSLQISSGDDTKVDVRLVERAGEVRVAVRTPDETLARTMREDLGSLTGKLSQTGFATESWAPARSGSSTFSEQHSPSGNQDGGSGQQQQQQQESQQEQQQGRGQRPAWLEEFDNSLADSRQNRTPLWQPHR